MGRRKFTEEEKAAVKEKRRQELRKKQKERKESGLCRDCNEPTCQESKIFCEKHFANHRINCSKSKQKRTKGKTKYTNVKSGARERGICFNLDKIEFEEWLHTEPKECFYCGIQENALLKNNDKKKQKLTIDRKDNNAGYKLDNICLACFRCNNIKSYFFTFEEWKYIANKMIKPRLEEFHKLVLNE